MSDLKSPLTPPCQREKLVGIISKFSPFCKGGIEGDFLYLGFAFSKQLSHVFTYERTLTIAWAKPMEFETTQGRDLL